MSNVSPEAAAAREQSRDHRGRFGPGEAAESDVTLADPRGLDLHTRIRAHYGEVGEQHRADPRSPHEQWAQDGDVPMADLNPEHPRRIEAFGAGDVDRTVALVQAEASDDQAGHACRDCGEAMEGYEADEYPPDYCDMCEGNHEDEA